MINMSSVETVKGKVKKRGKSALSGIHKFLFSRMVIILLLLVAEAYILFATFAYVDRFRSDILTVFTVMSIIAIIMIVNDKSNTSFKLPWCVLIAAAPVVGLLFFLFVKLNRGTHKLCENDRRVTKMTEAYAHTDDAVRELADKETDFREISYYLEHSAHNPTYTDTDVIYYETGEKLWTALLEELEKARTFIFMEFFVIAENSKFWQSLLDILKKKAASGVEVRLMYDGMCSFILLPTKYPSVMRKYGIKCRQYEPVLPVLSTDQNNRDHRKMVIIDGETAFTGGINLSDEYVNITHPFGKWKDTAVSLKGPAADGFTKMFLELWNMSDKAGEDVSAYFPEREFRPPALGMRPSFVIPYGDGMPNGLNIAESVYIDMLNTAKKYVHISTPYLVVTEEMLYAMCFAARRGVDIKLLLPGIPDKKVMFRVARSYYPLLLSSGVKIYQYTPGFNHAKVFVSDDMRAVVGTVNMDFRSFYHHYECAAYIYGSSCIEHIEEDYLDTIGQSQAVTQEYYRKINIAERAIGRFLRIFGYLL